ncbi:recombinase family protein [Bradyrhizobium iriomotense]|uniref:recombinase family protein n=1 Tax=Bradyrhizobium iriomotense TaxID=441950 RepID=UPI001B8A2CC6|nr:recombinase family protein [Bradyrhizobium iriomotense]MBR1133251.1 recombinase family protein [Bradyrhizobium iriomotense]
MSQALVVHGTRLPQSHKMYRAAQYVRMSTDHQQYSIENQAAVIATYAELHKLTLVRTYCDEGESGLKIDNRRGLTELINDVCTDKADFGHLLIFDVSRWGRFQDVDESAHYEFVCRKAGVRVAYCAEQFVNDGSLLSSIMKNIKRVMAAEFSRELSGRVHAASMRIASKGFRLGGREPFGLVRQVVDDKCRPKGTLQAGEHKFLSTDRVKLVPGPRDKVEVVRWIFDEYLRGKPQEAIARELNSRGIVTNKGGAWCQGSIGKLLRQEVYIGNLIYNRQSEKLGAKRTKNPTDLWVRSDGAINAIIDRDVFKRVNKALDERFVRISEEEMLVRLRKLLMKKGKLSATIIDAAPGLPSLATYLRHFGPIRNLYRMIGYVGNQSYWDKLGTRKRMMEVQLSNAARLQETFKKSGRRATLSLPTDCLQVDGAVNICFRVATCRKYVNIPPKWQLHHRQRWPAGWIVGLRLAEDNETILDYILMPSTSLSFRGARFCFSEASRASGRIERFDNFGQLSRVLLQRVSDELRPARTTNAKVSGPKSRAKPKAK